MAVKRKPYINYFEYLEKGSSYNDSEIPIFIGSSLKEKSSVKKLTQFIKTDDIISYENLGAEYKYKFTKTQYEFSKDDTDPVEYVWFDDQEEHEGYTQVKESGVPVTRTITEWFSSVDEGVSQNFTEVIEDGKPVIKQDNFVTLILDFFEENVQYASENLESTYCYIIDLPKDATIEDYLQVIIDSKVKKDATVIVLDFEDDTYDSTVKTQYKYSVNGTIPLAYKWFDVAGTHDGYTQIFDENDNPVTREIFGYYKDDETLTSKMITVAKELDDEIINGNLRIAYFGLDKIGSDDIYLERLETIASKLSDIDGCSRIAPIEKPLMGKSVARICTTPYYIEPGYDGYRSVKVGTFDEKSPEFADKLFNTGLIFNEDDYSLEEVTPRMVLATSCAWGIKNADNRRNDALLHARRNVDWQVRQMLKLAAPQLKRNETSVNIAFVRTDLINHLVEQKRLGRIVDYKINVEESKTDAYKLHIYGKIVPVNSSLAIEFSNYIGAPIIRITDQI